MQGYPFVHVFRPSPASLQGRIFWSPASPSSLFLILLHDFPLLSSCCADTKPVTRGPEVCAEQASVPACRLPRCLPASSPVPISLISVAWICSYAEEGAHGLEDVMGWAHGGNLGTQARKRQAHWWGRSQKREHTNTWVLDVALLVTSCVTSCVTLSSHSELI